MALWVEDAEKQKYLRDYFASINNIALRFIESKELVKKKHKDTWATLSPEEQEQAIDDYIIPTAVKQKYASIQTPLDVHETSDISSVFPSLQIETGKREVTMVCNGNDDSDNEKSDNELSWRDEHSDPFSWETRSQMNMTLPPPRAERQSSQREEKEVKKAEESVLSEKQITVQIPKPKPVEEKPSMNLRKSSINNSNSSHLLSKPTALPVATDVNKNKPDTVTEILHELDTRKYGDHLITVTSSIIDADPLIQSKLSGCSDERESLLQHDSEGRNEIEVKKVNIDEPKITAPTKTKSAKDDYFIQEEDDQHLLANAQPCADSSPSVDHTRLSGFDFLDNW